MKNTAKINVLIIDDHTITRFGLKSALKTRKRFDKIFEAESGVKGIEIARQYQPDIVIVDICIPGLNGAELIQKLKKFNSNAMIIILSSNISENTVMSALSAGARAYCLKNMDTRKLLNVIEMVLEGAIWFDPSISVDILKVFNRGTEAKIDLSNNAGVKAHLTERETDVLKLIVNGHNNAEISEKLCVSIHTAKAHVCNILHKLRVEDRTQAAILALKDKII